MANLIDPENAHDPSKQLQSSKRIYYGWWVVLAAFFNLFFVVGVIFYGFPVFYPYFIESLHFSRAQLTQGFLLGFLLAGLPFGILTGTLIDRIGPRFVILAGVVLVAVSLILWADEIFLAVPISLHCGSRRIRPGGTDRQSSVDCAVVSTASRASNGIRLFGPRLRRGSGADVGQFPRAEFWLASRP